MSADLSVLHQLGPNPLTLDRPSTKILEWHIITPEYPPELGGVSDYTSQLAAELARQGDLVDVWCANHGAQLPANDSTTPGVTVHRQCRGFAAADLRRLGEQLDAYPAPRRILVQWVPHGYGYRSMNLGFCWWLWRRAARHGDRVELIVHEPFLSFKWTSAQQNAAALAHRCMTVLLLHSAAHVWITIPGWEPLLRKYAIGRKLGFQWMPIFSNIPRASDEAQISAVRRRYTDGSRPLIGHFGTFGSGIAGLLEPILLTLGRDLVEQTFLLMGEGSEAFRQKLLRKAPRLEHVVRATGALSAEELAQHLCACDLLVQPYPDGVSTRRGSFMAGLINGRPIITTTGWLTEPLWHQTDAVQLAPAGETEAFLEQVRRLRADPAERRRLSAAASALYQERFDISHTISSLRQPQNATRRGD